MANKPTSKRKGKKKNPKPYSLSTEPDISMQPLFLYYDSILNSDINILESLQPVKITFYMHNI